jgi:hypothetical protein
MAAVPGTHDFADAQATSTEMNTFVRDPINFLLSPPIAALRQTVLQTITTATMTACLFDEEIIDSVDGHSTTVNTSRYTAVYAGWYQVAGGTGYAANVTNRRANRFAVNGTLVNGSGVYLPTTATSTCETPSRAFFVFLNVGDYVEFYIYQDSGGNLNTAVTTDQQCSFMIRWVSR